MNRPSLEGETRFLRYSLQKDALFRRGESEERQVEWPRQHTELTYNTQRT